MKKRSILMTAILLGSIFLFIEGCAPTTKFASFKPSIVESDFNLALKDVDLVYESVPGEVLKYDVYFSFDFKIKEPVGLKLQNIEEVKKEMEKFMPIFYSAELEVTTEKVSLSKDISSKFSMKSGKIVAKMMTKEIEEMVDKIPDLMKFKKGFRQVISNKGKILYSDSDELWGMRSPQFFPDHSINIGDQWSNVIEVDTKELGKVKFSLESKLVGFKLIEGRPCAKIITELKPTSPIWQEGMLLNMVFTNYHDLKIGQFFYGDFIMSANLDLADMPAELKGTSVTMESVSTIKLNYRNSIFKRPIN